MSDIYDIIIIGGGPAGLAAGIYGSRAGFNTLLLEKVGTGGQLMQTDIIDNYPGFPDGISGFELQERMVKQALKFDLKIINDEIIKIEKKDNKFILNSSQKEYQTLSVIIASGSKYKKLEIPGEKEFAARGVSYCGTCDAPFFKDKNVVVIGGGDSALTEALFISKFAKSVKIIHRKERFRAIQCLINEVQTNTKIESIYNSIVTEIKGDNLVKSVLIKDVNSEEIKELNTEGVFIFIGLLPNTDFIDSLILDNNKFIVTNSKMQTKINGFFACGDVRSETFRQVVCAVSDGATAANYAGEYINELKGKSYR